jgi:hypothetical protein
VLYRIIVDRNIKKKNVFNALSEVSQMPMKLNLVAEFVEI